MAGVYNGTTNYQVAADSTVYFLGAGGNVLYRWGAGAGYFAGGKWCRFIFFK